MKLLLGYWYGECLGQPHSEGKPTVFLLQPTLTNVIAFLFSSYLCLAMLHGLLIDRGRAASDF